MTNILQIISSKIIKFEEIKGKNEILSSREHPTKKTYDLQIS